MIHCSDKHGLYLFVLSVIFPKLPDIYSVVAEGAAHKNYTRSKMICTPKRLALCNPPILNYLEGIYA